MLVFNKSKFTGKVSSMELNVTQEQIDEFESASRNRTIQQIFPNLTPEEREFMLSGSTPEEWNSIFPDREND